MISFEWKYEKAVNQWNEDSDTLNLTELLSYLTVKTAEASSKTLHLHKA